MNRWRWIAVGLLLAALVLGTASDKLAAPPPILAGGYRALTADFHVHPFPQSWSPLAPWDLVLQARRDQLDAIAVEGHNHLWVGQAARWFSTLTGGPTVIPAEEIHPPRGHILALGIAHTIDWRLGSERAVDEIHRQGGVAIAAHPFASSWDMWSPAAMRKLDGVEVVHPSAYGDAKTAREFRDFYARAGAAAIGDSDFHGLGPIGLCRTWVFAQDNSAAAILDAIREKRTATWDGHGYIGNPELARVIEDGRLEARRTLALPGAEVKLSRACALLGLLIGLFAGSKRPPERG
jgi:predicted metal-dependent phosphoesterase TrpH